ncbi:MAG TPA: hypothetical protein VIS74_07635, partial [Chthoniobacterales bacterium]
MNQRRGWHSLSGVALAGFLAFLPGRDAGAQESGPLQVGFETAEGFAPGPLNSFGQWTASGVQVVNTGAFSGTQALGFLDDSGPGRIKLTLGTPLAGGTTFVDF